MLENLYGKHAAALYAQAADFNKTARFYYMKAEDAYYLANAQASYDDWRRARRQWDYFYRYAVPLACVSEPFLARAPAQRACRRATRPADPFTSVGMGNGRVESGCFPQEDFFPPPLYRPFS